VSLPQRGKIVRLEEKSVPKGRDGLFSQFVQKTVPQDAKRQLWEEKNYNIGGHQIIANHVIWSVR
jgi:hypothetical protein